jgi:hypothetical protein
MLNPTPEWMQGIVDAAIAKGLQMLEAAHQEDHASLAAAEAVHASEVAAMGAATDAMHTLDSSNIEVLRAEAEASADIGAPTAECALAQDASVPTASPDANVQVASTVPDSQEVLDPLAKLAAHTAQAREARARRKQQAKAQAEQPQPEPEAEPEAKQAKTEPSQLEAAPSDAEAAAGQQQELAGGQPFADQPAVSNALPAEAETSAEVAGVDTGAMTAEHTPAQDSSGLTASPDVSNASEVATAEAAADATAEP